MRILITGASGFVGKELANNLKKNHKITKYNISNGDNILDEKNLNQKMKNVDCVIHLAAKITGTKQEIWETNTVGTKKTINSAIKNNVKKFILLSSTGVYGDTFGLINENSEKKPITVYEKSKLECENIVLSRSNEINVNIIRSAMIFGANEQWKKMFLMLKNNFPLPCNGKNSFQIIYVKDLIEAIKIILKNGKPSEIYLVSGKEKWTLKEFCKYSKKELKKNQFVLTMPKKIAIIIGKIFRIKILNKTNIRHLCKERNYNIEKITNAGFKQKYTLKKAIKKTIKELKI